MYLCDKRKRQFRRPRHRWDININMDFREMEWEGVNWTYMAEERGKRRAVVNTVLNLRVI